MGSEDQNPDIAVGKLVFDFENPRLAEYAVTENTSQFELLKILWENLAVREVALSIAHNGYFRNEPLFVEPHSKNRFVVIEGNRRLAAVQLLLDENLRRRLKATDLPTISSERRKELSELPVLHTTRKEAWSQLGFKHVNGPATWGSYAKAQYIAKVHNDYKVALVEIARRIGDYHSTVERMYHGLMVIEQAEHARVFDRRNTSKPQFYFNYMYDGLNLPGFRQFLGLGSDRAKREPVPKPKLKNLKDLCLWLYGDATSGVESVIQSQNPDLKILGRVLLNAEGVSALRDGLPLSVAEEISEGDERIFRKSIQQARQSLQKAHATLTTGYDPEDREVFELASDVERLSIELVNSMETRRRRGRAAKRAVSPR
jgi:hypothetical protein